MNIREIALLSAQKAVFNAVNQNNGCFKWDNNITTKIAGMPINLTILSGNSESNTTLTDSNITKIQLLNFSDSGCSLLYHTHTIWQGNDTVDENGCFLLPTFTYDKAVKCAKIKISGISSGNLIESNSSDTFSIRPNKFILANIPLGELTAEHDYTFNVKAVNNDGSTITIDFNTSLTPHSHKYFRDNTDGSAMAGDFVLSTDFIFSNGLTSDTTLSFNNVGKIGLELNDTTWAEVDSDDTALADRTIYLEQNLTFIPDHFKIEFPSTPLIKNHYTNKFTYLSNNLGMSAKLQNINIKVTALGEKNSTMTNYQNPQIKWYANLVNITPNIEIPNNPNRQNNLVGLSNYDLNFSSGVATYNFNEVKFNYDRNYSKPINPFTIKGSDINITIIVNDVVDNDVNGTITNNFDKNATFYYGRMVTKDIKTNKTPTNGEILFVVYSTNTLNSFEQYTSNWYINKYDNFTPFTPKAQKSRKYSNSNDESRTSTISNIQPTNGRATFDITANQTDKSFKAYYHIGTFNWLWYSKYKNYWFVNNTTCAQHPCFEYIFQSEDNTIGIKSGDYNGTKFENSFKSGIKKKAIKLLR